MPATNEASLNLYTLINLYKYDGRVSKFWSLKNDIIVKSPKVITVENAKTNIMFFLISGNNIIR